MSSFIWECIRQEDVDAMDYLSEIDKEPVNIVRQQGVDDVSFAHQLRSNLFEVDFRGKNLQQLFESLSNRVDGLSSTRGQMTGKEREAEDDEFERFNDEVRYATTLRLLKVAIRKNERIRTEILKSAPIDAVEKPAPVPLVVAPKPLANFALPTLQLPTFGGIATEWLSFWDRFRYAVHDIEDDRLPPVIKLSHLLNCVKGQARDIICGLPICDTSYKIAVKLLTDQYGASETNIKLLYGQLEGLRCNSRDNGGLLKFSNELEKVLLQLEHLGEDTKSYSLYLSIVKKLPYHLLKEIVHDEKTTPRDKQLQMVRDKIRNKIREHDDVEILVHRNTAPIRPPHNPVVTHPVNQFRRPPLAIENRVSSLTFATPVSRTSYPCIFCESTTHRSPSCDKFTTLVSRVNKLNQLNRCSKCARPGHTFGNCRTTLSCHRCGGNEPHLTMMCPRRFEASTRTTQSTSRKQPADPNPGTTSFSPPPSNSNFTNPRTIQAATNVNSAITKRSVLLKCVQVDVVNPSNPSRRASVLAMFDDGSTTSYISSSLVDKLKLHRSHSCVLSYGVFGDPAPRNLLSDVVSFSLIGSQNTSLPMTAQSVGFLSRAVPHALVDEMDEQQIQDATYSATLQHGSPDILIGMDHYDEFEVRHRSALASGLSLFDSKLGFIISGSSSTVLSSTDVSMNTIITLHASQSIEEKVSKFFDIESIGIDDSSSRRNSLVTFQDSVKFNGERYEVRLPWNHDPPALPNNLGLCLGRLRSTIRSLRKTPELLQKYHEIIMDQLARGIIEEVHEPRQQLYDRPVHYLPHQPVIREDKGKVRIVYDASAKCSRHLKSLNDCLDPGPTLLENLVGVLLRFRLSPIVVACDIEKAFLQVVVNETDRDATRFIWLRNLSIDDEPSNLVTFRFKRVPFGLTCSPFLLAATLITHFQKDSAPISQEILDSLYVDNILLAADSVEKLQHKCNVAKEKFAEIGMNLREFVSNDSRSIGHLDETDRLSGDEQHFLGIKWKLEDDSLWFQFPLSNESIVSKRLVLSSIASTFDPLGLLAPAFLSAKLFFQKLWQQTHGWDDKLSEELTADWLQIRRYWITSKVRVPRQTIVNSASKLSLHVFTDASRDAFACCVYLVSENVDGMKQSNLIFAKSKVRPTRFKADFSIHRMELLGVVAGVRAIGFTLEQLSKASSDLIVSPILNLWTDSSTVLHWLRSTSKQDVFVQNRINVVRQTKDVICRYVSTDDNPADVASRGCTIPELVQHSQWWHGPRWLTSSQWPSTDIPEFDSNESRPQPEITVTLQAVAIESIVDVSRFSSFEKLVNSLAYVLRFVHRIRRQQQFPSLLLSVEERKEAQLLVLREAQELSPPSEAERNQLKLYKDEHQLLRSKGRIEKSTVATRTQDPIYLPRRSPITRLIIFQEHRLNLHSGSVLTLSQLRRKYWIPQGRRTVISAIRHSCMICRRFDAQPFRVPDEPQLPAERVTRSAPFEFTGVDYFGPLNVKVGRSIQKVWVALFTCLTVRAVHLEIVNSLSAASYLLAFKRFVARRGLPRKIWSDNGTQFTLAAKTLNARLQVDFQEANPGVSFEKYLAEKGIRWEFITEHAPWKGGFYERLVGITKHHLRRTLQRELLQIDAFTTLLTEIETVVNLRPITFLSDNVENPAPLRPIDFLSMNIQFRQFDPHPFVHTRLTTNPSSQRELLYMWEEFSQRLDSFWVEWVRDYLLALRERQRRIRNSGVDRVPEPGELVLLFDGSLSRSKWKTAVVVQGEPREDGAVRTASVRLSTGNVVKRAISHLFPLEASFEQ